MMMMMRREFASSAPHFDDFNDFDDFDGDDDDNDDDDDDTDDDDDGDCCPSGNVYGDKIWKRGVRTTHLLMGAKNDHQVIIS